MFVDHRYKLSDEVKKEIYSLTPQFGFGGFGETTYYRTYSRIKPDGSQEHWPDTVIRVVEGVMSIRIDWMLKHEYYFDPQEYDQIARDMAFYIFHMKMLPPGRGCWVMGTEYVFERGSMSLNNCGAVKTSQPSIDFAWAMDALMCGVGVGFGVFDSEKKVFFRPTKGIETYVIPDSREGWVESLKLLLESYEKPNQKVVKFDYSLIRLKGAPIGGFGGKASGPEPLQKLHERVRYFCNLYTIGAISWTNLCADIANSIGCCVVAGNVRRCLPWYSKVKTIDGYKQIKDIEIGDMVYTKNGTQKVTNKFDQGEQQLIEIEHNFGTFKCTENHKVAVFKNASDWEFKKASELKPGDTLVFDSKTIDFQSNYDLPKMSFIKKDHDTMSRELIIPDLDEEIAWFIGLFHGDGYVYIPKESSKNQSGFISVSCNHDYPEIIERVKKVYSLFGQNTNIRNNGSYSNIICSSSNLAKYFYEFIKQPNTDITIPDFIKYGSSSIRKAYLSGIFDADGSCRTRPINLVYTVYEKYTEELKDILLSLGILPRIKRKIRKPSHWKPIYDITIKGIENVNKIKDVFQYSSKFSDNRKTERSTSGFTFPSEFFSKRNNNQRIVSAHCGDLEYLPLEIKSISKINEITQTYDIEVENEHHFTADGLVVHNSAEILIGEVNDKNFLKLKDYESYDVVTHNDKFYQCTVPHYSKKSNQPGKSENWQEIFNYTGHANDWRPGNNYYGRSLIGWMSNNTVRMASKPDFRQIPRVAKMINKRGEPGFYNLLNVQKYGRFGDEIPDLADLCNPCQPGWAPLLTKKGITQLKDVNVGDEVWSETGWTKVVNKWSTGVKDVYEYRTSAGVFYGTENHRIIQNGQKVEVCSATSIDRLQGYYDNSRAQLDPNIIMDGLVIGDGSYHKTSNSLVGLYIGDDDQDYFDSEIKDLILCYRPGISDKFYEVTTSVIAEELEKTFNRDIPDRYFYGDHKTVCSFLRGLYSANGTILTKDKRITFKTASKKIRDKVQIMLSSLGISSYFTTNKSNKVRFSNGEYECKQSYDINISGDRQKFMNLIGFIQKYKNETFATKLRTKSPKINFDIIDKTYISTEEVFDITVDNQTHTYWSAGQNVSNCGEIPLLSYELCNLSEVFPTRCKTKAEFYRAVELATFYASTVSLLPTHDEKTNKVIEQNRRIGVSLSGIADWVDRYGMADCIPMMRKGYKIVREVNARLAKEAGVSISIRVTTTKPSGSISQLAGVSSGMHYPTFRYAIRRIRIAFDSPVAQILMEAGVPWEFDQYSENTYVFEFPIDQGMTRPANEVSAWEQFALLGTLQREWSDNMVSCTIYYDPKTEADQIERMLAQFAPVIKSVSILPHTEEGSYPQMPYEGITEEEYEKRKANIRPIDWSQFGGSDGQDSKFCTNDTCSI